MKNPRESKLWQKGLIIGLAVDFARSFFFGPLDSSSKLSILGNFILPFFPFSEFFTFTIYGIIIGALLGFFLGRKEPEINKPKSNYTKLNLALFLYYLIMWGLWHVNLSSVLPTKWFTGDNSFAQLGLIFWSYIILPFVLILYFIGRYLISRKESRIQNKQDSSD